MFIEINLLELIEIYLSADLRAGTFLVDVLP